MGYLIISSSTLPAHWYYISHLLSPFLTMF
jgi:hypothetical protein